MRLKLSSLYCRLALLVKLLYNEIQVCLLNKHAAVEAVDEQIKSNHA